MSSTNRAQCAQSSLVEQMSRLHEVIGDSDFAIEDLTPNVCAELGHIHPSILHAIVERAAHDGDIVTRTTMGTFSWQPAPQLIEAARRATDLPMFTSVQEMLESLTPDETAALELLADCDQEMELPTQIRNANQILRLMKPDEREEFAERMYAGGVFSRHGENPSSPDGVIWALQPARLHHVLTQREAFLNQSIKKKMESLREQEAGLTTALADLSQQSEIAQTQLTDLQDEDQELLAQMRRIKQRRAEIRTDMETWDAARTHLQAQSREVDSQLQQTSQELQKLESEELDKQQARLDEILDRIDTLNPAQLKKLRARLDF